MIIVFILFVLLAIVFLLPSQITSQKDALDEVQDSLSNRLAQLKNDFQFRTKELARRLKSNDLAEDEWQKLSDELQLDTRTSIDSIQIATDSDKTNISWLLSIVFVIVVIAVVYVTYQFTGSYQQVKHQLEITSLLKNDAQTIDKFKKSVQTDQSQQALDDLYLALRTKVELLPSNIYSWSDLALFNANYGRIEEAREAMTVALKIEPNNIDLKIDLAQILSRSENKQDTMLSRQIIQEVLRDNPGHEGALLLLGFSSYNFGMYQQAVDAWGKVLISSDPGSPMSTMLIKRINQAQQLLGSNAASANTTAVVSSEAKLRVKLEIPDSIRSGLTGREGLFIFAKAVNGPRFPIAVIKTTVAEFSGEVILTDANAMRPEFALSKFDKVKVSARISFSGAAVASMGDIQGESEIFSAPFPTSTITVVVDQTVK